MPSTLAQPRQHRYDPGPSNNLLAKHRLRVLLDAIRVSQQYELPVLGLYISARFWKKSAEWLENEVTFLSLPSNNLQMIQGPEVRFRGKASRSEPMDKGGRGMWLFQDWCNFMDSSRTSLIA